MRATPDAALHHFNLAVIQGTPISLIDRDGDELTRLLVFDGQTSPEAPRAAAEQEQGMTTMTTSNLTTWTLRGADASLVLILASLVAGLVGFLVR